MDKGELLAGTADCYVGSEWGVSLEEYTTEGGMLVNIPMVEREVESEGAEAEGEGEGAEGKRKAQVVWVNVLVNVVPVGSNAYMAHCERLMGSDDWRRRERGERLYDHALTALAAAPAERRAKEREAWARLSARMLASSDAQTPIGLDDGAERKQDIDAALARLDAKYADDYNAEWTL